MDDGNKIDMTFVDMANRNAERAREERMRAAEEKRREKKWGRMGKTVLCCACTVFALRHIGVFLTHGLQVGEGILVLACIVAVASMVLGDK